jgi:hypothetical protein
MAVNKRKRGEQEVKTYRVAVLAMAIVALSSPMSLSTILTFDDLPAVELGEPIPDGYGGFDWPGFWHNPGISGGYENGAVSVPNVAYNYGGVTSMISDATFDFTGAYLTGAWNDDLEITVEGYFGDQMLYSETVVASYYNPTWFSFEFTGVDMLKFTASGGHDADPHDLGSGAHIVMDDFTFVPEPGTLSLLGLAGLAFLRKRRP